MVFFSQAKEQWSRPAGASNFSGDNRKAFINTAFKDDYDDPAFSGGNMDRPAMKRLLKDIQDDKVDVVVVYKIDRLTRGLMTRCRSFTSYPSGGMPPIHMPFFLLAVILSRIRSPVTSLSNCALTSVN
jgi:hypothetical protein